MCSLPLDDRTGLEAFRIAGLPPDFYYIPNFISHEEEASILQKVCVLPNSHLSLQIGILLRTWDVYLPRLTPCVAFNLHTLKLYLSPTPLQVD